MEILGDYDVVVDGTDNFPTRYLTNDACVLLGKPNGLRRDPALRGTGLGTFDARTAGPATAASSPSRRRRARCPRAPRAACSACCPASSP